MKSAVPSKRPTAPTELIVPLDFAHADLAMKAVDQLRGLPLIYKVGFELFMNGGPEVVRELVHRKCRVFLDLKFNDIPNTVAKAARQAALLHVDMFTLHLTGGRAMVEAAARELADLPALRPKILGVTVLTSFDDVKWAEVTRALSGHAAGVQSSVEGLAGHAAAWGADGLVCSAMELQAVREIDPSIYTVVPGIRPEGSSKDDQARVMTPAQAHAQGASAVVVGRPITSSENPRAMAEKILKDLAQPMKDLQ